MAKTESGARLRSSSIYAQLVSEFAKLRNFGPQRSFQPECHRQVVLAIGPQRNWFQHASLQRQVDSQSCRQRVTRRTEIIRLIEQAQRSEERRVGKECR